MYGDLNVDLSEYFTDAGSPLATLSNLSGMSIACIQFQLAKIQISDFLVLSAFEDD